MRRTSNQIAHWIATGFGSGYAPIAPGTAASAVALLLAWCCRGVTGWWSLLLVLVVIAVAIWSAEVARHAFDNPEDPSTIVVDEIAGIFLAMWGQPWTWATILIAFFGFRLLDVFKPWPIRRFERLPGGLGIVADDLAAGAGTWVLVTLLTRWS
ncbi:MAG: phosphatidylglycerophosphatase A [Deltaproteobacteria bacterium]|nr:phosphatidylglycerophosphatase A [Deltaproteobacteria bacterium]